MRVKYPTWKRCSRNLVASQERLDGVADWHIMRDPVTNRWHISGRTSAHWHGQTFATAAEAMRFVEQQCARRG